MTVQIRHTPLQYRAVGEIAAAMPGAVDVFRKYNVNFCCRGHLALDEAARQRGIETAELAAALDALEEMETVTGNPATWSSDALIDHIQTRFHETHRRELVELIELSRKVEAVHAEHPRVPRGLARLLRQLQGEIEVHMKKEELILFPAMRRRAGGGLDEPISRMRHEHGDHGDFLDQLATMTESFTTPDGACRSWQALYAGLAKFTGDMMDHVHLENFVLFPRYEEPATS